MSRPAGRRPGVLRRLIGDEGGFVLVFFAVALPALLGLVGLAVDGARLMIQDSELAAEADAAALAAAGRLDRSDTAIRNAIEAANGLSNGTGAPARGPRFGFRFASTLSELRASPTSTLAEASGREAVYVEVTTAERSFTASLLGLVGARPAALRRRSIAESQYYACDVTPLLMCHRDPDRFLAGARPGRQYVLRLDGTRDDGALMLLDPAEDRNGRRSPLNLASDRPAFCLTHRVVPRPNFTPAEFDEALNIRFDRYATDRGPVSPDYLAFPPAPNIVQGRRFNACTSPPGGGSITPPYSLPRDSAFATIRRATPYDAGTGDWTMTAAIGGSGAERVSTALDEYIAWNHADKPTIFQDDLRRSGSRFALYLKELGLDPATQDRPTPTAGGRARATMPTGGPTSPPFSAQAENPVPRCYPDPSRATDARRRIVYVTVADCAGFAETASAAGLSGHVAAFFLTEPSDRGVVPVEFVDKLGPADPGHKLRHVVQLVDTR